ncbi:TauD/TfdA dioxygenase family protein [Paenibacillus allorhizosphaerae]|uniref:Alpha-ketoglutarate-dependent taurine dioxygenase n=1 Tax=Paenibacillus allorhizosphaerae TaxID=2849866 RepID=A0ABM8V9P7_9BACL|nr:TauD/TfdA family dioxygenase [Paenibacillus allorhizosphaerae]CAG7613902.1 Alpha-ketoglutarate-dependent taurine dioxygenase [Paenibacillus allorhizosphaerae]
MSEIIELSRLRSLPERGNPKGSAILRRLPEGIEERTYTLFSVKPLSPIIGAEISGVDLSQPISPELHAELNRALLEWKVIFFRDQRISSEQQKAFARLWGELETHPFLPQGDTDEIVRFTKGVNPIRFGNWHTDVTWRLNPALGAILRLVEVPPAGGNTIWADMGAAYDNLPDEIKERIDGLTAIHDFTHSFGRNLPPDELAARQAEFPAAEHPVVRTHPETGRKTLFVNSSFTTRIVGLDLEESEQLLQYLFRQVLIPEYQVRFQWEANSIAFWDNRATQHYAVSDYYPHRRIAERVAIVGDRTY